MVGAEPLDSHGSPINTEFFDAAELTNAEQHRLHEFLVDVNSELRGVLADAFEVSYSMNPEPNVPYLLVMIRHPVGTGVEIDLTPESNDSDILDESLDTDTYDNTVEETARTIAAATIYQTREIIKDNNVTAAAG